MLKFYIVLTLISTTWAWWCNGHMLTAMIAELDLMTSDRVAHAKATETVQVLNGALTHGISNTFVESACWADDIKNYNVTYLSDGHFLDMVYNPEGLLDATASGANVIWALNQVLTTLKGSTVELAPLETSLSIRYLIHIAGDLHQPLHCTNMWDSTFPKGDEGGNLFTIKFNNEIKELHAFWDSGAGVLQNDLQRPMSADSWNLMLKWADDIMAEWPRSKLINELKDKDPADWCLESYLDGVNYAYKGAKLNEKLSQVYVDKAWQVVKKRMALGGYRLSDMIAGLY